ncbi:MAG: hypothetical protein ACLURV_00990 [Gallintestinimicrobium sp.]
MQADHLIAAGFLFIGSEFMGGWKNIDKINSRYIHFGGSDTFIGLNFQAKIQKNRFDFVTGNRQPCRCRKRQQAR